MDDRRGQPYDKRIPTAPDVRRLAVSFSKTSASTLQVPAALAWKGASLLLRLLSGATVPAVVLLGLLFVIFTIGRLLPTDPVLTVIGDHAPQALYEQMYSEMHLDKPIPEQFVLFVIDMARETSVSPQPRETPSRRI